MDIVLHMLNGYLLASKAYLHCHLKETADFDRQSQTVSNLGVPGQPETPEVTREELKNALLSAQVFPVTTEAQMHFLCRTCPGFPFFYDLMLWGFW